MAEPSLPSVAVVGRPNVGKSTLVNRIVGGNEAIVEQRPGVTRDRKVLEADWQNRPFELVDTGGWLPGGTELDDKVSRQSERAMEEADAIVLVVDGVIGVTEEDQRVARILQRLDTPVLVAVNKIDSANREVMADEFWALGLDTPWPVSALHGLGTGDLLDALVDALGDRLPEGPLDAGSDEVDIEGADRELFSVALVGRPNVGKSTLFNRLIGDERSVVHDLPGTTRDSIDTTVETDEGPVRFVDTAGMRRRAKVDSDTEQSSLVRALRSVDSADVALLVVDSTVGVTHQDQRLAERIDAAGCPIVVLLNKWELLDAEAHDDVEYQVGQRLHFLGESPVLKISALTGRGVQRLLPALGEAIGEYHARIPTGKVNKIIREAQAAQPAPHGARVLYATQGATDPPTFTLFTNRRLDQTYLRYLERSIRSAAGLTSTPIKLRVRRRS